jgi:hypothetical protein
MGDPAGDRTAEPGQALLAWQIVFPVLMPGKRETERAWLPPRPKENEMPRVALNQSAPDFSLPDYSGRSVRLSDFRDRKNVLLVFNRTFT